MPIQIHMLSLGALQTNCYIVADTDTREAIVIDPSDEFEVIWQVITQNAYTVREILATHGHFDHVLASKPLVEHTNAPFRIHEIDAPWLARAHTLAANYGIPAEPAASATAFIKTGDEFKVGSIHLTTLFTPGHSAGHVSFVLASEQAVFSGDCLFMDGIGRTDLPGGNYENLMISITEHLMPLGDAYQVMNGHGPITTIGRERQHNGYIRQWLRQHGA